MFPRVNAATSAKMTCPRSFALFIEKGEYRIYPKVPVGEKQDCETYIYIYETK